MRYSTLLLFIPLFYFSSCSNDSSGDIATADSVTLSRSIAAINSSSRKIIHTADLRCRVGDVYKATSSLEDIVRSLDGAVTESKMENEITNSETLHYSTDSQKIVNTYVGTAHLTLRVPVMFVDSVLKQIPALVGFIDSRSLKQDDVTFTYLSNAMKNEAAGVAPPVVSDAKGELVVNNKQTHVDTSKQNAVIDRRIENLQLLDNVNYATLRIDLYQPASTDVQIVADPSYIASVPFGAQLSMALVDGWSFFKPLMTFLVRLWPLWLIAAIGVVAYRRLRRRNVVVPGT